MQVTKIFTFDAAHQLIHYGGTGNREPLHGHTYTLHVTVEGPVRDDGMVIDFKILKHAVKEHVLAKLDHTNLNDTIENPSAENIAIWIWRVLHHIGQLTNMPELALVELKVFETADSFVTYRGGA